MPASEESFTLQQMAQSASTRPAPHRQRGRAPLVAGIVAGAVVLMLATGAGVWWVMRPDRNAAAGVDVASSGNMLVAGVIRLRIGQFAWNSKADPTCYGWKGFDDIRGGAQVTVTDDAGKVLAVGKVDTGTAEGITDEPDGTHRADSCALPFRVSVSRGHGPYGVEISHRGVLHYEEGNTATIALGFD